jgi:hypothetical protein
VFSVKQILISYILYMWSSGCRASMRSDRRSLLGLTSSDHQRNTTVWEKLKVEQTVDGTQSYQKNWLQHVQRMEHSRVPRMALEYQPKGKSNTAQPKTRWWGQEHLQNLVSTGHEPGVLHLYKFMMMMMMIMIMMMKFWLQAVTAAIPHLLPENGRKIKLEQNQNHGKLVC